MNYKKAYDNLIETRRTLPRSKGDGIYYERHHIIPKSMSGSNTKENLVRLTAREHFLAHLLLWKIHNTFGMASALRRLTDNKRCSSRDYETARLEFAKASSIRMVGEKNPAATLSNNDVIYIYTSNKSITTLCNEFGSPTTTIHGIKRGASWSSITKDLIKGNSPHSNTKLDTDTIIAIFLSKDKVAVIAKMHNTSQATVSRIRTGKRHAKITGNL